jgi:DNA-binding XRE family transcriptional regulator
VTDRDQFASRLRELRESKGFSAARHFAHALGISENRYTRYERGKSEPSLELIYKICATLQISPDELFGIGNSHPTPGMSSGAQAPFGSSASPGAPLAPLEVWSARDADAAAWDLASMVARLKTENLPPMAELSEVGRLFAALRQDPYETVARIVVDPAMENIPDAVAADLKINIDRLLAMQR